MPKGIIARVFADTDWRDDLDPELVEKLEKLLKRTKAYEDAYKAADDPAMAQLWVAMAEVFYQLDKVQAKMRKLERQHEQLLDGDAGMEDEDLRESLDKY